MTFLAFFSKVMTNPKNFLMNHKKGISLLGVFIFYCGFLALGGYIFCLIEGPHEVMDQQTMQKVKTTMLAKYPSVSGETIDHLYEELSAAGVKGIVRPNANDTAKWTFGNSFLFSMTLLTTIGFGHVSPATQLGKIVCMIYTTMGIPITLLILTMHVEFITSISDIYKANLFRSLGYRNPFGIRTLHFITVLAFVIVGTFILPAWVFFYLEISWTYLDAIYFCFISLTTIGLGDFVPGIEIHHPNVELYRFFATIYLLVGVTVVMFLMGLISDYYHNHNKGFHIIPDRVIPEKVPIITEDPPSYGTIVIPETNDQTKLLLS